MSRLFSDTRAKNASSVGPVFVNSSASAKTRSRNRHLAGDSEKSVGTQISVIVPVFNEAPLIRSFLQHLRERAPEAEIIVADGGSSDGTERLAAGFCDRLVQSERGRGRQMNAGAIAARFTADHGDRVGSLVLVDTLGLAPFQPAPEFGLALTAFLEPPWPAGLPDRRSRRGGSTGLPCGRFVARGGRAGCRGVLRLPAW